MALVEKTISAEILAFMNKSSEEIQKDPEAAKKQFADDLAGVIVNAIRTATVNPGIPVTVAGPLVGATTGAGTLS